MSSQKGGGTLQAQIEKLEHDLERKDIDTAHELAVSSPTMIRLAFKYLDKPHCKKGLSKGQLATFEQFRRISPESAEKWKADRLVEKK